MVDCKWCSVTFERFAYMDVCRCAAVCSQWREAAADPDVWRSISRKHFDTHYVPECIKDGLSKPELNPVIVLRDALRDLRRVAMNEDELHSFTWNFRFKATAGPAWTSQDPWWNDQPAVKIWFRPGGVVERQPEKPAGVQIQWRWGNATSSTPGSGSPPAQSLRCTVNDRDVPTYRFGRHPIHGGFFMHSCWALYTSFPMPAKGEDANLTDEALNLCAEDQIEEVQGYNHALAGPRLQIGDSVIQLPMEIYEMLMRQPRERQMQILRALLRSEEDDDSDASSNDGNGEDNTAATNNATENVEEGGNS